MAFTKKTWKDRIAQYLNRRRLTDVDTGDIKTVTVTRDEGGITEEGDIFNAATMNDLENRINTAFTEVNAKTGSDIPVSSSDTKTTIAEAIDGIDTKLTDFIKVKQFSVTIADSTRSMDLTSRAQAVIDNGYKFLAYISVVPTNFSTDIYLWISRPYAVEGRPWWNTNPIPGSTAGSTVQQLTYTFLEIRN